MAATYQSQFNKTSKYKKADKVIKYYAKFVWKIVDVRFKNAQSGHTVLAFTHKPQFNKTNKYKKQGVKSTLFLTLVIKYFHIK